MKSHICQPSVSHPIDRHTMRHIEQPPSPFLQDTAIFSVQSDDCVTLNRSIWHELIVVRIVESPKITIPLDLYHSNSPKTYSAVQTLSDR